MCHDCGNPDADCAERELVTSEELQELNEMAWLDACADDPEDPPEEN